MFYSAIIVSILSIAQADVTSKYRASSGYSSLSKLIESVNNLINGLHKSILKEDLHTMIIPGVTDDPNHLVTIHSYQKAVSDAATAACPLPDVPGLGLIEDKTVRLGQSVVSQDCKTYRCIRVYETDVFDVALISEFWGCWEKGKCRLIGEEFEDDKCYSRGCEIIRSKYDDNVRSNIKFITTAANCPTADGGCVRPGAKHFDCFMKGAYDSHCICKRKGSIAFLDSLMRFGKKVGTIGGNANGKYCFFRFKAFGETYNSCVEGDSGSEWCAVTDNFDRDGQWGYCIESPRYRYTKDDLRCHLPFKYNGKIYHDCTSDGSEMDEAWCSTQFLYDPAKKGVCAELSLD